MHTQMRPAPLAARGYARDPIASMLATDWRILLVVAMDYAIMVALQQYLSKAGKYGTADFGGSN
jgi:hypothetical protein